MRIKIPKIPKGNLKKVYVLSEKAANEFFIESSAIVKECWPLPETYTVPSREDTIVTLKSYPHLWLPRWYDGKSVIGRGSFGIVIAYSHSFSGRLAMSAGCGQGILEFLCEAKNRDNHDANMPRDIPSDGLIVSDSHIFVYNMCKLGRINLPSETVGYGILGHETVEELNRKVKPSFAEIADRIECCMEKRGAVLTRGMLSNQFVI